MQSRAGRWKLGKRVIVMVASLCRDRLISRVLHIPIVNNSAWIFKLQIEEIKSVNEHLNEIITLNEPRGGVIMVTWCRSMFWVVRGAAKRLTYVLGLVYSSSTLTAQVNDADGTITGVTDNQLVRLGQRHADWINKQSSTDEVSLGSAATSDVGLAMTRPCRGPKSLLSLTLVNRAARQRRWAVIELSGKFGDDSGLLQLLYGDYLSKNEL